MAFIGPYVLEAHLLDVPECASRMVLMSTPGRYTGDPIADLSELRRFGASVLVSLQPQNELVRLDMPELPGLVRALGLDLLACSIPDHGVPTDPVAFRTVVHRTSHAMCAGRTVAVSCSSGLGRTGLFAACVLVSLGVEAPLAMARVGRARPGAIARAEQRTFVRTFANAAALPTAVGWS